ncbi:MULTISPECIES: pyridoxamine 5'-phosphate oxidase family protein [Mycolicibacter]|uniref:pyridoxamine 5'-phosphate oxidase family protein n=1 Tax=Mycolicibacter TaxID=1073531 RepID=UPI00257027DE|nr:pyridoxamine 5'-phosphate oxidase family protein [Mycolicibacter senuensis]
MVEFTRKHRRAVLFCRDDSGQPIGYAMHSIRAEPGNLYFSTYAKSAKVGHLRADPAVACILLSDQDANDTVWVSVRGVAEVYQPSKEEVDEMTGAGSSDHRVPDSVVAKVRDRLIDGKRSMIRVTLDEVCAARLTGDTDNESGGRHRGT